MREWWHESGKFVASINRWLPSVALRQEVLYASEARWSHCLILLKAVLVQC